MLDAPVAWQTVLSSFTPVSQLHPSRLVWAQDQLTSLLHHRAPVPLTWSPARPITLFFRRTKTSLLLFLLFYFSSIDDLGFPGGTSGKEPACQCRRHKKREVRSLGREDPLEERMATHTPLFLLGQRSLVCYGP